MPRYRLYYFSRFSGQIQRSHEFEADGDEAAIAAAEGVRGDDVMELWCRQRKVRDWEARPVRPMMGSSVRKCGGGD
jgi:hypothetical protein